MFLEILLFFTQHIHLPDEFVALFGQGVVVLQTLNKSIKALLDELPAPFVCEAEVIHIVDAAPGAEITLDDFSGPTGAKDLADGFDECFPGHCDSIAVIKQGMEEGDIVGSIPPLEVQFFLLASEEFFLKKDISLEALNFVQLGFERRKPFCQTLDRILTDVPGSSFLMAFEGAAFEEVLDGLGGYAAEEFGSFFEGDVDGGHGEGVVCLHEGTKKKKTGQDLSPARLSLEVSECFPTGVSLYRLLYRIRKIGEEVEAGPGLDLVDTLHIVGVGAVGIFLMHEPETDCLGIRN